MAITYRGGAIVLVRKDGWHVVVIYDYTKGQVMIAEYEIFYDRGGWYVKRVGHHGQPDKVSMFKDSAHIRSFFLGLTNGLYQPPFKDG